ncbi:MAG TPA: ABC transporter permease, partial [Blastocatellia bacterium]|nr:ABC transporter permease [Blastocatellia bacterium]
MRYWREFIYMLRRLRRRSAGQELDDEIRSHLELEIDANIESGMSAQNARNAASKAFGSEALSKELTRSVWGFQYVETILQDVKYGVRMMRRNPAFTLVALLTLTLTIGAASSVFSVLNAVLIRKLPYPGADQLVLLHGTTKASPAPQISFTDMEDWKSESTSFEEMVAFSGYENPILSGSGEPEHISEMKVSDGYFALLRSDPLMGRTFQPEDQQPGGDKVAVLAYGFWNRKFGADPNIIGKTLILDGFPHTVVGVMPPGFRSLPLGMVRSSIEVYVPLAERYENAQRAWTWLRGIARLKPNSTIEQAQSELNVIAQRQESQYADTNAGRGVRLLRLKDAVVGDVRTPLLMLQAAVVFLLLIGCVNL